MTRDVNTGISGTEDTEAPNRARPNHGGLPPWDGDGPRDRIQWGPVWVGVLTTLTTSIVLQLLFVALGWLGVSTAVPPSTPPVSRAIISGVLGLIAFLLGGIAAGASGRWWHARGGVAHGLVSWALTVIVYLGFALAGGSALLGWFIVYAVNAVGDMHGPISEVGLARLAAGWAVLGLVLSAAASGIGGWIGAKRQSRHARPTSKPG